jgi:hypothetical protein
MDAEVFLDMANHVAKLKMYPYFDLAHAVVCCLAIKEDLSSGALTFSRCRFYEFPMLLVSNLRVKM